jgi:hypothetical protein
MDSMSQMIRVTLDAVFTGGGQCVTTDFVIGSDDIGHGAEVYPALLAELRGLRSPDRVAAKM